MEEKGKAAPPSAVGIAKATGLAFLFGGVFSVIGQLFVVLWTPVLGADHPLFGFAVLVTMGVLGMALFVSGLHQRLAPLAGFGLVFPFNGFCAAVSDAYVNGRKETGAVGGGFIITLIGAAQAIYNSVMALFGGAWTPFCIVTAIFAALTVLGIVAGMLHIEAGCL